MNSIQKLLKVTENSSALSVIDIQKEYPFFENGKWVIQMCN